MKSLDALGTANIQPFVLALCPILHILDKLKVDYYGTPTPLQQVGNVTVPEARVLMIQPWESKLIKDIEKAILASDIGITPTNRRQVYPSCIP